MACTMERQMFLRVAQMLVLATGILVAAPAFAGGEIPAITAASDAVQSLRKAEKSYQDALTGGEELAHRLAAMKRLRGEQKLGTSGALEDLLRASQAAEKALAEKAEARNAAKRDAEKKTALAMEAIKAKKGSLRTGLLSKNPAERTEAAKKLRELEASYNELQSQLASVSGDRALPRAWKQYEVKIDPLDGPAELREKADFVEDLRDKFLRRKREVEARLAEARQEREVARLAKDFHTETTLFDEQSVSSRVARTAGSGAERATTLTDNSASGKTADVQGARTTPPPLGAPAGPQPSPPPQTAAQDGANFGSPAPESNPGLSGVPGAGGSGGETVRPAALSAPVLPKQLDLNGLLNLSSKDLDRNLDVDSLEALLKDLGQLDAFLSSRAGTIRSRAATLESDETRAKGSK